MITLGCHKWTLRKLSTRQAAHVIRALGFERMDLGNAPDLDPLDAANHVRETVAYLNSIRAETGLTFVDVFPQLPQPPNHPDAAERQLSRVGLAAWFRIAADAGLAGITLTPGHYWPGHTADDDFARAAEELCWAVEQGQRHGLVTRIEPHVSSVTWTPQLAVRMVREVPGLSLTLDHSHFVFHDIPYEQIATMHPHGTHWHARQARPGDICCACERGTIDFGRIVGDLACQGYAGTICLEFTGGTWMSHGYVDAIGETMVLADQLRAALQRQ